MVDSWSFVREVLVIGSSGSPTDFRSKFRLKKNKLENKNKK